MRHLPGIALAISALACSGNTERGSPKPSPGADVEIAGTWHDCASRLELRPDGTFALERLIGACSEAGHWSVAGDVVTLTFEQSSCSGPSAELVAEVALVSGRMVWVAPDGTDTFYPDATPRARFELVASGSSTGDPANGASIVRIVGDPGAPPFSGCYYSADGACGGFLSCGGSVDSWQLDAKGFVAKLGCTGPCPCSALLEGKPGADGSVAGGFAAFDCGGQYSGSFVLKELAE